MRWHIEVVSVFVIIYCQPFIVLNLELLRLRDWLIFISGKDDFVAVIEVTVEMVTDLNIKKI